MGFGANTSIAPSNAAPDSSTSSFFAISKNRADCAGSVVGVRLRFRFFVLFGFLLALRVTSFLRHAHSASNCAVRQPLADHAAQELFGALFVGPTIRLAMVIPEVNFAASHVRLGGEGLWRAMCAEWVEKVMPKADAQQILKPILSELP